MVRVEKLFGLNEGESDDEEFASHGDKRDFRFLALFDEAFVEVFEDRMPLGL